MVEQVSHCSQDDDYEYGYDYLYESPLDDTSHFDNSLIHEFDSDDEILDDQIIGGPAATERLIMETNVLPAKPSEPVGEAEQSRVRLRRQMKEEALKRFEEAARTEEDFREVIATWDRLDQNRERRERYHEILRGDDIPLEYGQNEQGLVFPRWYMNPTIQQLSKGNYLDYFADCPYEMHNLTSKPYLSRAIKELKEDHKEIFFFLFLRQYSPQCLATMRDQTDRNIRKVRDTLLKKLRKKIYSELKRRSKRTNMEQAFLDRYDTEDGSI